MEQVLDIYERSYNRDYPVVCFDERLCQLLGDVLMPIPMKPGRVERQDYEYKRNGTCVVLMAVEPLAGRPCYNSYRTENQKRLRRIYEGISVVVSGSPKNRFGSGQPEHA